MRHGREQAGSEDAGDGGEIRQVHGTGHLRGRRSTGGRGPTTMAPGMAGQAGKVPASPVYGRERGPRPSASPRPAAFPLSLPLFISGWRLRAAAVGASAASSSSPSWRGGRPAPPIPFPPRQQVARGRPVAARDHSPLQLPAALAASAGARPLAPQRTAAGPPSPALRGAAAARRLLPPLCGAPAARPLPLPSMAWRGGGGACCAHCPRRPPRGASRGGASAARGRWGGGRPVGGSARPLPTSTAGVRGRSSARSHGRSSPDRRLRFCEMTWPNKKPRNWPGIVGRDGLRLKFST